MLVATRIEVTWLESILYPNASIAEGFEMVILDLGDDVLVDGILKEDSADRVVIYTLGDGLMEFSPDEIKV
ncbi:MAG: hypothetical protein M2R45_04648 [Verrucomicrobia subdivision 3 bacterium]|nr:hypothetical protein [Limisphaerales bacterium]MCS1417140.1 hypothetical protein [Limisphaerales bacterium]